MDQIEYILTLLNLPGIGRKTVLKILEVEPNKTYKTEKDLVKILTHLKEIIKRLKIPTSIDVTQSMRVTNKIIDKSLSEKITIIPITDKTKFPKKLATYSDPPVLIHVKGGIDCLNYEYAIAVIGTRKPTKYGAGCCRKICQTITERKIPIVSGLAKGCDSIAHEACIEENGTAIAILAHGLHMIYPAENSQLANDILDKGGCLLSEYPVGTEPKQSYFVERDRLQTALSNGVLFIESGIKGGTMHAVKECIKNDKPLACLKHSEPWLSDERTMGNQKLIGEKKATPIFDSSDLENFITNKILIKSLSNNTPKSLKAEKGLQLNLFLS
jgi:DNA processing protein